MFGAGPRPTSMPSLASSMRATPFATLVFPVLFLLGLPAAAASQTVGDSVRTDSSAQALGAISVSSARAVGVAGGAGAVVVNPMELRTSPAPTLDQALRESPFVLVRQNSRGEMEISVRGSDSRQASVLLDGVPMTLGWDHRTDPSLIPLTGSERLVIVRGLGSLLNGPNSLGGTIEISHDAFGQPNSGQLWAGAGLDQFGSSVTTLGYGRRIAEVAGGALSVRAGAAHRHRDGVALPSGAVDPTAVDGLRTGTDLTQLDGFASLRWNDRRGRSLGVMYSAYDAERGVPPEDHLVGPRLWRYPYARRGVAMLSANTGLFKTPLGQGSLEVGVGINSGVFKLETFTNRTFATVDRSELGDERTVTSRALFTHTLGPAMLRASHTGANIRYVESLPPLNDATYRQQLSSTGVEVELPIAGRTQLAGGVVFDRATTPETGGRIPGQAPLNNAGWRVGATHELTGRVRLHASVSERSRFPALRELYSGALDRFRPNPELTPETLLGAEGGMTLNRLFPSLAQSTLQVIGFRHLLDDAVVRITLANPTRFQRINRDRMEITGAELLGGLVFGRDPNRSVSLNGDATIQRIRIFDVTANDQQRRAENNPEQRGRLELGAPLPASIKGFAVARYTGRQYCLNADTSKLDELQARTAMDVAVERPFTVAQRGLFRSLRALLSLDNIGNVAVYDQCGLPQPGRTLRLTMTVR